jgi:hypothetical protein
MATLQFQRVEFPQCARAVTISRAAAGRYPPFSTATLPCRSCSGRSGKRAAPPRRIHLVRIPSSPHARLKRIRWLNGDRARGKPLHEIHAVSFGDLLMRRRLSSALPCAGTMLPPAAGFRRGTDRGLFVVRTRNVPPRRPRPMQRMSCSYVDCGQPLVFPFHSRLLTRAPIGPSRGFSPAYPETAQSAPLFTQSVGKRCSFRVKPMPISAP